jgi:hypothetical protein
MPEYKRGDPNDATGALTVTSASALLNTP